MSTPTTAEEFINAGLIVPFSDNSEEPIRTSNAVNTVGVDTHTFDAYRQGISMTMPSHWWSSTTKLGTGNSDHTLSKSEYGFDTRSKIVQELFFKDIDRFDPVWFINSQTNASSTLEMYNAFTYPIVITNDDFQEERKNGILEPLTIRDAISFSSIDAPHEIHDFFVTVGSGNENMIGGRSQIVNVFDTSPGFDVVSYLDVVDTFNAKPTNGYFIYDEQPIPPFDDVNNQPGIKISNHMSQEMKSALNESTPNTDSYLNDREVSMTSGFTYSNENQLGTDSIAFGGLTHLPTNQISSSLQYVA